MPPFGDIAIVVAGALIAGFVNGLSGTGYALTALGFWLHAMSPATAAPLTAICAVGGHIQSLPRIWQGVRWPRLWPFLLCGLAGVPLGTALLAWVPVEPLKLGVGLMLIGYCAWMTFVRRPPIVHGGGRVADGVVGFVGGVMGGVASVCGPVPMIWTAICLPATVLGAHLGLALYGRINEVQFRRLVLALLAFSGLTLIGTAVF